VLDIYPDGVPISMDNAVESLPERNILEAY
jgi:hypothetical protein